MTDINYFNQEDKEVIDHIIEIAEQLDFSVHVTSEGSKYTLDFQKYSPAGQDFSFTIEIETECDETDIADKINEYYENYDVSYETYIWLDNTGHGANGAPYEMIDVYNDMKECEQYIKELADEIYNNF